MRPSLATRVHRRTGFWLVALAFFVTMLGSTLPTPLYVIYQQRLGFSTTATTVIFAAYALGVLAALLLFGRASDVLGRRRVLIPGLGCAMLSGAVFLAANSLAWLAVARLLSGLAAGIFTGTATAALVDLAGEGHEGRATLVATLANMGGLGAGPLIAGLLAGLELAPLRLPFAVHLGLLALVTLGVWLTPETVATSQERLRIVLPKVPATMRGTFARAALAGFAGFAVLGMFTAVWPAMLRRLVDISHPAVAGASVFVLFAASAVGQLTLVRPLRHHALAAGSAMLAVGMVLFGAGVWTGALAVLTLAVAIAGLGQGVGLRAALGMLNAKAPVARRAEVVSAFFVVVYTAISMPVIGVGVVADTWDLRTAGTGFSGAVAALAVLVVFAIRGRWGDAT